MHPLVPFVVAFSLCLMPKVSMHPMCPLWLHLLLTVSLKSPWDKYMILSKNVYFWYLASLYFVNLSLHVSLNS